MTDDRTENARLAQTRRSFLRTLSGVGAAFALPTGAGAATMPEMAPGDQMRHHAEALLALVRMTFPDTATGFRVHLSWEAGMGDTPNMTADALERVWETDSRIRSGAFLVDRGVGRWRLENGVRIDM